MAQKVLPIPQSILPENVSVIPVPVQKNSLGDEIANVNFYAVRPGIKLPEFAEITQNNGHYAIQGYSRSPILVPIESSYTISH